MTDTRRDVAERERRAKQVINAALEWVDGDSNDREFVGKVEALLRSEGREPDARTAFVAAWLARADYGYTPSSELEAADRAWQRFGGTPSDSPTGEHCPICDHDAAYHCTRCGETWYGGKQWPTDSEPFPWWCPQCGGCYGKDFEAQDCCGASPEAVREESRSRAIERRASDSPEREDGTSDLREAFLAGAEWMITTGPESSTVPDEAFGRWLAARGGRGDDAAGGGDVDLSAHQTGRTHGMGTGNNRGRSTVRRTGMEVPVATAPRLPHGAHAQGDQRKEARRHGARRGVHV